MARCRDDCDSRGGSRRTGDPLFIKDDRQSGLVIIEQEALFMHQPPLSNAARPHVRRSPATLIRHALYALRGGFLVRPMIAIALGFAGAIASSLHRFIA